MAVLKEIAPETTDTRSVWEESIDSSLRDRAHDYLNSLVNTNSYTPAPFLPQEDDGVRVDIQRQLREIPPSSANPEGGIGCVVVLLVVITIAVSNFKSLPFTIAFGLIGAMVTTALIMIEVWQSRRHHDTKRRVTNEVLPSALEQVVQNRTERAYLAAVQELMPSNGEGYLTSDTRVEQIHGLNTLLASGRRLETVRTQIAAVLKDSQPEALQEEIAALQQRAEKATDEATKNTLLRSLALCEERLSRNRSLYTLLERLDAESELVYQAFGATRSSLASLRIAPASAELYPIEETVRVSEVADTIARQTKAVELAVQELGIRNR